MPPFQIIRYQIVYTIFRLVAAPLQKGIFKIYVGGHRAARSGLLRTYAVQTVTLPNLHNRTVRVL
jgi:hypothetical protein